MGKCWVSHLESEIKTLWGIQMGTDKVRGMGKKWENSAEIGNDKFWGKGEVLVEKRMATGKKRVKEGGH